LCHYSCGCKADECQRTKPAPGQPQREVRVGYLILDILFLGIPFTAVDFITAESTKIVGYVNLKNVVCFNALLAMRSSLFGQ